VGVEGELTLMTLPYWVMALGRSPALRCAAARASSYHEACISNRLL
jgi:hypothetical protein